MLTEDQIHHFRVFGFILLRQVLNETETEELGRLADVIWTAELGHKPTEDEHVSIAPFLELHPAALPMIEDDRFYTPMVQLLGQDMIWSGSEGVQGTMTRRPFHHWHADRPGPQELGYLRIKIMMYLDPMRKNAGALRVIPGSQPISISRGSHAVPAAPRTRRSRLLRISGQRSPLSFPRDGPRRRGRF